MNGVVLPKGISWDSDHPDRVEDTRAGEAPLIDVLHVVVDLPDDRSKAISGFMVDTRPGPKSPLSNEHWTFFLSVATSALFVHPLLVYWRSGLRSLEFVFHGHEVCVSTMPGIGGNKWRIQLAESKTLGWWGRVDPDDHLSQDQLRWFRFSRDLLIHDADAVARSLRGALYRSQGEAPPRSGTKDPDGEPPERFFPLLVSQGLIDQESFTIDRSRRVVPNEGVLNRAICAVLGPFLRRRGNDGPLFRSLDHSQVEGAGRCDGPSVPRLPAATTLAADQILMIRELRNMIERARNHPPLHDLIDVVTGSACAEHWPQIEWMIEGIPRVVHVLEGIEKAALRAAVLHVWARRGHPTAGGAFTELRLADLYGVNQRTLRRELDEAARLLSRLER